jgi:hypothetical protein
LSWLSCPWFGFFLGDRRWGLQIPRPTGL